ncbi:unnamed protein product [Prorocentrum cordatum]|uniref:Reverse transcriptase domain-containing protein n=1 Tax=Prorocentrum cordatum TaxID=2364126 RepID=A0ABN9U0H5_9DINO|nr:unnamed protein product [Polarella glacialis]
MADIGSRQKQADKTISHMAEHITALQKALKVANKQPVRETFTGRDLDRAVDLTIIKVHADGLATLDRATEALAKWITECGIDKSLFQIQGQDTSRYFTIQFTGLPGPASRRVLKVLGSLRNRDGSWTRIRAPAIAGSGPVELRVGPDKSPKQIKTDIVGMRIRQVLERAFPHRAWRVDRAKGWVSAKWVLALSFKVHPGHRALGPALGIGVARAWSRPRLLPVSGFDKNAEGLQAEIEALFPGRALRTMAQADDPKMKFYNIHNYEINAAAIRCISTMILSDQHLATAAVGELKLTELSRRRVCNRAAALIAFAMRDLEAEKNQPITQYIIKSLIFKQIAGEAFSQTDLDKLGERRGLAAVAAESAPAAPAPAVGPATQGAPGASNDQIKLAGPVKFEEWASNLIRMGADHCHAAIDLARQRSRLPPAQARAQSRASRRKIQLWGPLSERFVVTSVKTSAGTATGPTERLQKPMEHGSSSIPPGMDGPPCIAWPAQEKFAGTLWHAMCWMLCGGLFPDEANSTVPAFLPAGKDAGDAERIGCHRDPSKVEVPGLRCTSLKTIGDTMIAAMATVAADVVPASQRGFTRRCNFGYNILELHVESRIASAAPDAMAKLPVLASLDIARAFPSFARQFIHLALKPRCIPLFYIGFGIVQGCGWSDALYAMGIACLFFDLDKKLELRGRGLCRARADDLGLALAVVVHLSHLAGVMFLMEDIAGLAVKPAKCRIIRLAGPVDDELVFNLRNALIAIVPLIQEVNICDRPTDLGPLLGPGATQSLLYAKAFHKFRWRTEMHSASDAPSMGFAPLFNSRPPPVLSYLAQCALLLHELFKSGNWVNASVLRFPNGAFRVKVWPRLRDWGAHAPRSMQVAMIAAIARAATSTFIEFPEIRERLHRGLDHYADDQALLGASRAAMCMSPPRWKMPPFVEMPRQIVSAATNHRDCLPTLPAPAFEVIARVKDAMKKLPPSWAAAWSRLIYACGRKACIFQRAECADSLRRCLTCAPLAAADRGCDPRFCPDRGACDYFPTSYFRAATMRRLGALTAPPGATCRMPRKVGSGYGEDVCGQRLDPTLKHPQLCNHGPARMRPHRALAAALARLLQGCRAEVDVERTVPKLVRITETGAVVEAVLDLVVTFPGTVKPLYIDVSIRCPHASRYRTAATSVGEAARAADTDTRARYGAEVLTVAFETYGRLGAGTHRALEHLATQAGACMRDQWAAPRLVPTWRAALERVVHFAAADIDLLALGCTPTAAELPSAAAAPAVVLLAGALPRARRRPGRAAAAGRGARRAAAARAPAEDGPRRRAVGALLGAWWAAGRAGPAAASPALASLQADEIDYVVDGDTVKLKSGTRLPAVGVNTPETVAPKQKAGAPPDCYGPEASSLTKSLLPKGTKVRLESDAEPVDRFGRSPSAVRLPRAGRAVHQRRAGAARPEGQEVAMALVDGRAASGAGITTTARTQRGAREAPSGLAVPGWIREDGALPASIGEGEAGGGAAHGN